MKISRMNKGNWGKVRAFFDLTTQDGFTIKGFKLIEGINGLFVSMPSQKGNDDEYYDTIWIDSREVREQLTNEAIKAYNNDMTTASSPMVNSDNIASVPSGQESSGDNIKKETNLSTDSSDSVTPAFSDEDIPF